MHRRWDGCENYWRRVRAWTRRCERVAPSGLLARQLVEQKSEIAIRRRIVSKLCGDLVHDLRHRGIERYRVAQLGGQHRLHERLARATPIRTADRAQALAKSLTNGFRIADAGGGIAGRGGFGGALALGLRRVAA